MLNELLERQQTSIDRFFRELDRTRAQEMFDLLNACKGMLFFTGVGKSGIIAKKIAMTMVSTGTRALYLSPTNALHGDLGIVTEEDVFVLISKGGETEELTKLIPCIRAKGARVVSWVSKDNSRLAQHADLHINLPVDEELCPFGLAPTTSAAVQLIFGDLMAVALMRNRGFALDQYAKNHPAGQIGKRVTLKVRDLMLTGDELPLAHPEDRLGDRLVELTDKRCGCLLVTDEKRRLQGIFTDGDLRRALQDKRDGVLDSQLGELMTTGARSTAPDELAWEAAKVMEEGSPVMVLPVLEEEHVVGLVKMHDVIQSGI